jgi:hypothetical protein
MQTIQRVGFDKRIITGSMMNTASYLEPKFRWHWFHREIAEALMDPNETRIIITVPSQHYKSTLAAEFFPLWFLGNNPDKNVIVASYSAELAERHSAETMGMFQSHKYQQMFGLELDSQQCNKGYWKIKGHNGGYVASGIRGTVMGVPADVFILDDYYATAAEARSETVRTSVKTNYRTSIRTRLQSEKSKIIIIATRYDENDLIGEIIRDDVDHKWRVLVYPAFRNWIGDDWFTGEPLMKSREFYRDQVGLDAMSPIEFETMFMCNPTPRGDMMLSPDDWQVVPKLPEGIVSKRVRGHDIAYTGTGGSDDSANALLVRVGQEVFLCDANSWVAPWHETKQKEKDTIRADDPGVLQMFETNGGQSAIVDDLKRDQDLFGHPIWGTPSKEKKQIRALPWILKVKGGQIKMVDGPHKRAVFEQCSHFRASGDARYDGIIDSISKAWEAMGNTVDLSGWLKA